jgi:linoleoyl-CoA desaturase
LTSQPEIPGQAGFRAIGAQPTSRSKVPQRHLTFSAGAGFYTELKHRVEAYFLQTGKRERDSVQMYVKAAIFLGMFAATYVLLAFVIESWQVALPLAGLLGVSTAGIGFNIMHDAGHGAFSRYNGVNKMLAWTLDMIGGSSYFWRWKHGVYHHTYSNIFHLDTDLEVAGLGRFAPHQAWHPAFRWQHWYVWLLYGVMAIKWHIYDDFRDTLTGHIGEHEVPRPKGWDLVFFIAGKTLFFSLAFGIPLLLHPWWVVAIYYVVATSVLGILLSVVFQLAHCVENAEFPAPPEGRVRSEKEWAVHQVETTVDFLRRSRIATWLLGGLNFQVEHHLFPRIAHVHYPALSRVVEEACRDFGVQFKEHRSLWSGIVSHVRWVRRMGQPDVAA